MPSKSALVLVDIQNDFLEAGSLAVPDASFILPAVQDLIRLFKRRDALVIATQDWHPEDHISFASNHGAKPFAQILIQDGGREVKQILWPDHCVQDTHGAELAKEIPLSDITHIIKKGKNQRVDSYSAFADNNYDEITPLAKILYQNRIETVVVVGLAADYCVKMTCLDSIKFGFETVLVREGTRAVYPQHVDTTIDELAAKGVHIIGLKDISQYLQ
ncbi:nicotinamidase-like amidase [Syncephalastrum racemosum]|uniref:nicotinamidase n=1 Tax=Syncephalastrum racemosum TaxID=13706 RepID=A0A1X2HHK6_SYNRA|nr:nicotinamidase-like amidase [Syncephalastrum racemosum]